MAQCKYAFTSSTDWYYNDAHTILTLVTENDGKPKANRCENYG